MKQQINFYAKLEPIKPRPKAVLAIAGFCVVTLIGYFGAAIYLYSSGQGLQARLTVADQQHKTLQRMIDTQEMQDQQIDLAPLEARLTQLRIQQRRLQLLVKNLQDPTLNNKSGFSAALTGLARQHVRGVAIEKFEFTHRGRHLLMAGKVLRATSLPVYMAKLGSEAAFDSMTFEKITITENEGELDFEIASLSVPLHAANFPPNATRHPPPHSAAQSLPLSPPLFQGDDGS